MNHNLEYAIMIFLAGLLIILFLWSKNGRYQANIGSDGGVILIDTRSGNHWILHSDEMILPPDDRQ